MKKIVFSLIFQLLGCFLLPSFASSIVEDGVYSISCQQTDGYVALGAYHSVSPYICYVQDGQPMTEDAYWIVTNTEFGYTFQNEISGEYIIYTTGRVDAYYKNMTLSAEEPDDGSQYWNITEAGDGSLYINSNVAPTWYWNLRASQGLLGTYEGSSRSINEQYYLTKKGEGPDPNPQPETQAFFPDALHVYLNDGRIEAYPLEIVTNHIEQDGQLIIRTNVGQTFTYAMTDVEQVSEDVPTDFPTFESFKFNKKYNDQLFVGASGEMTGDTVNVSVVAIGKRLTPSFTVPDEQTLVYVDGVLQESKVSRHRFEKDVYYLVTRPGITILLPNDSESNTYSMQPYGRIMRVHVDWLTDRAEVPTIYINTSDGQSITSKDYYKDATISIDGHDIFPSMETTAVQIKGRGNSSWGWPKKPYRLKFAEKQKPLGMTNGKSWVLLSNYQTGSLMSNAIGMKVANLMGATAANHIVPVDLYLNGEYCGNYNLTEKVGFSNNSIDLEDESAAALLELDSYYDEPVGQKFYSQPYDLPINIKEPDFSEGTSLITLNDVETDFNEFMSTLYNGEDITRHVDLEQLVRFMMVNELICNYEIYHPKSTFCYKENFLDDASKYIFGPIWDLDWAFGYEGHSRYYQDNATSNYWLDMPNFDAKQFIQDLRFKSDELDQMYRELWEEFMENDLTELMEFCQDYYDFAHNSFSRNSIVWGDYTNYQQQVNTAANWLDTHANQIYEDIINNVRPGSDELVYFDNNKLYTITCKRGALVLNAEHTGLDIEQNRWDAPEEDRRFAIINIDEHNYLYSPVTGQFLDCKDNGTWVNHLGSEIIFKTSRQGNPSLYTMQGYTGGNWLYFNNSTKELVINSWNTLDDGNQWDIEPVEDYDPTEALQVAAKELYKLTFDYVFEGEIIHSEHFQLEPGSNLPTPNLQTNRFFYIEPEEILPQTIDEDNCHIVYQIIWNGPFQFTHSLADAHWYNVTIRSNYYVGKDEMEPYYPRWVNEETLKQLEYQWAFGGNPLHVKVFNRSTKLNEVLTRVGSDAVMRQGDYSWDLLSNNYYDGFVLREHNTEYSCINQIGGSGGPLQFWNDSRSVSDNGSTFRVTEAPEVIIPGDVNGDGEVDLSDAIMVTYYSLHVVPANFNEAAADMNGDVEIDLSDAIIIIYKSLGVK